MLYVRRIVICRNLPDCHSSVRITKSAVARMLKMHRLREATSNLISERASGDRILERTACDQPYYQIAQCHYRRRQPAPLNMLRLMVTNLGTKAGLDGCGKSRSPLGFNPRIVQPVASRYTDWAIPAHPLIWYHVQIHFNL